MPELNRTPRIDAVQFDGRFMVVSFLDPANNWSDGGSKTENLLIPIVGREDAVNEILDDVLALMDEYLADRRNAPGVIRGHD